MNNNRTISAVACLLLCAVLLATGFTSCLKPKTLMPATGTFYLHMHTDIDTNEVDDTTALYRDSSGRYMGLSVAQFYISNITLHNVNGSTYTFAGVTILKSIDSEQYLIGQAPVGTYDYVTFTVGLYGPTNNLQPAGFTNNGYLPNSAMWFGSTSQGYMFMKLQGFADTTTTHTGTNLVNFSYEIGSVVPVGGADETLKTVTMPARSGGTYKPYILNANNAQYIHIICDYGKLLSVVNFKTQDTTIVNMDDFVNPTIATTIANNIPYSFHYEE